ncbi:histidine phosphatase family protein [Subtercola boreus]|nr:histidine phosphatase family protein [Subtercola boreus]
MTDSALRIHLVRHAETLFNVRRQLQGWCDSPLTPRGLRQVEALGEYFAGLPLVAAFSSDLTRTRTTTAGALAGHPHLVPEWMPALREWNFGGWEGQPNPSLWTPIFEAHGYVYGTAGHWDQLTVEGPDTVIDLIASTDTSGMAEDAAAVNSRMRDAVAAILGAATSGDVLVVAHGAVLQSLAPLLAPGARISPGYPNCGVTTVTISGGRATLGELDASCALLDESFPALVLPGAAPVA